MNLEQMEFIVRNSLEELNREVGRFRVDELKGLIDQAPHISCGFISWPGEYIWSIDIPNINFPEYKKDLNYNELDKILVRDVCNSQPNKILKVVQVLEEAKKWCLNQKLS